MNRQETRLRALTIVGPGRAGSSLYGTARKAGIEAELIDRQGLAALAPGALSDRVTLLAVPDSEIEAACAALCLAGPPGGPVGHLSGATPLSALAAAKRAGSPVFSLHPLQTFADRDSSPAGAHCAVTAEDEATAAEVRRLAEALGMRPFTLREGDRAAYHAAASIASNFLVTLEEMAAETLAEIGIENGREILAPLVAQTVANWSERGASALTGPIARGDEGTVERHLAALRELVPDNLQAYAALAERTRRLAQSGPGAGSGSAAITEAVAA